MVRTVSTNAGRRSEELVDQPDRCEMRWYIHDVVEHIAMGLYDALRLSGRFPKCKESKQAIG